LPQRMSYHFMMMHYRGNNKFGNYKEFAARNRDLCKLARRTMSREDPPYACL
jgi:hypothetical protein